MVNNEMKEFICNINRYQILSHSFLSSLFTRAGFGWLKGGRAYQDAIKKQCAAYFRLKTKRRP